MEKALSPNTPFWADKSFVLVVLNVVGILVASIFNVHLNAEALAADAALVLGYVAGNKVKSGAALLALIKAKAAERYVKPEEAGK